MEMEVVDEPCWPEREKLRRVKRAEEAVAAVQAKAVKAEVKAAVVLAQAWAREARARVEGLLLREELRREEKEKDEEKEAYGLGLQSSLDNIPVILLAGCIL
jgi:hypothetical protein